MTRHSLGGLVLAAVGMVAAPAANAVLMMSLTDSGTGETITLSDSGDGLLFYIGSVGDWDLNITTGLSAPLLGPEPRLDLNTITVTGGAPSGNLTLMLTDTDYSLDSSYSNYYAGVGGTTDGTASFQAYLDNTNQAWGMGTLLHDSGWMAGTPFSSGHGGGVSTNGLFSLTLVATLSHTDSFSVTSFDYLVTVPEPLTLLLCGIGLMALGFSTRRSSHS